MNWKTKALTLLLTVSLAGPAMAGSIFITGHDVLDHGGQNGFWRVILDYLRGAGTGSEIAEASYTVAVVDTNGLGYSMAGWGGSVTWYDASVGGNWTSILAADVIVFEEADDWSCAGMDELFARKADIEAFFDAGGDLWFNSDNDPGACTTSLLSVLPPQLAVSGSTIDSSTGFVATAAGTAIGIVDNMINGHATHTDFSNVAPGLTTFETYQGIAVSIGAQGRTISTLAGTDRPIPTLSEWALWLLVLCTGFIAFRHISQRRNLRA